MKKLNEVSFDELHGDKNAKFYFHARTKDLIDKIEKPSLKHPFFITDDVRVAKMYLEPEAYLDIAKPAVEDKIIYILRLNDTQYFNFFNKEHLSKIIDNEYVIDNFNYLLNSIRYGSLMDLSEAVAVCADRLYDSHLVAETLNPAALDSLIQDMYDKSEKFSNFIKSIKSSSYPIQVWVVTFFIISLYKKDFLNKKFKVRGNTRARRFIKSLLFKIVVDKTSYKIVGEKDTIEGTEGIKEFAVLDISVIKDVYPYPVKADEIEEVLKKLKV